MKKYRYCETPIGQLLIVAGGDKISGVYFEGQKYFPTIAADWSKAEGDALLDAAAAQFSAYFDGKMKDFELPLAATGTPFQQSVWNAISSVKYGERITYGELARRVGRADCVRAAGTATGRNPISVVVPCHRIIGANGSLTGYAGGLTRKQHLLEMEAGGTVQAFSLQQ